MKNVYIALAGVLLLSACQPGSDRAAPAAGPAIPMESGIDFEGMDNSVRPQDDFFAYANGSWVKTTEIPGDQSSWGSFNILRDNGLAQLQTIIDRSDAGENDSGAKIGNYYNAFMNEARVNALYSGFPVQKYWLRPTNLDISLAHVGDPTTLCGE